MGAESTDTTEAQAGTAAAGTTDTTSATDTAPPDLGDAGKRAIDAMKAERDQAVKDRRAATRELEQARTAGLNEAERAVAEAKTAGRTEALTQMGERLARSEFVAAAARRNAGYDAAAVLDDLNLARYVGDDGEPDVKALTAAVERLIPSPQDGATTSAPRPDLSQGAKGTSPSSGPEQDFAQFLKTSLRQ